MKSGPANSNSPSRPDPANAQTGAAGDVGQTNDPVTAPEDATRQDWVEADRSRPTLPEETADGLDDMDEAIRHQAEDLPLDTPGRLR